MSQMSAFGRWAPFVLGLASGWGSGLMMIVLCSRWLRIRRPAALMWPWIGFPFVLLLSWSQFWTNLTGWYMSAFQESRPPTRDWEPADSDWSEVVDTPRNVNRQRHRSPMSPVKAFSQWCSHTLSFASAWGVAIQLVTADVQAFMWHGTFQDLFRAFGVKRVACVYSLWTAYRCHHEPRCI